jgi:uncharacterized protein YdeI (YjbR/CyaY-like superfamily)
MAKTDPRVDAYIARSADFAKPILKHLRKLVHQGCPEVEESIKWGTPHFLFKGMLCGMAAFKGHCAFGFWNRALKVPRSREAMGQFGRITALSDLPAERVIVGYVKEAARLNEAGVKRPPRPKRARKELPVPADLESALGKNSNARAAFENFSPSHKREYVEWITEAKGKETRAKRLETAIAWMAEGKARSWKYRKRQPAARKPKGPRPSRLRPSASGASGPR